MTPDAGANDQLLYFTSPSLTADGRTLFFISDRAGAPNVFALDLGSGAVRPVSRNPEGTLRSYVYFAGTRGRGLGLASPTLHAASGTLWYLQGPEVMVAVPGEPPRPIARIPDDQVTAFTHVSADGRWLCIPTTDARALEGPLRNGRPAHDIDARVRDEDLSSFLRILDLRSSTWAACERVRRAWVTHVSFRPGDPRTLLYNHEWPADCGVRRVWLWDGGTHRPVRTEREGRSRADWTCHEFWAPDGASLVYHGTYADAERRPYLGRFDVGSGRLTEIALAGGSTRYGHFTAGPDGRLVTDGYAEEPDDPPGWAGAWLSVVTPDWDRRTLAWRRLCRHGSSWASQDAHPHPVFDPGGRFIDFTSDRTGRRAVWRVGPVTSRPAGVRRPRAGGTRRAWP